ncbi:MAG: prepilin-type N-terminal cleavage/methylation domain-containing protein [Planctomycetes bacterium]|nr:prepilin-type N-terminal cleavage/methylation domain-containing protein [Planctomycetota bacterium]
MLAQRLNRSGFSLVEVLFAAGVISVVLLGSILLLSHDMQVSKSSISVQVAQNQAQTLIYSLEKELSNARGERPVATLTGALGAGAGGVITLDSTAGMPTVGMVTIDRGTNASEHIAYATLSADGTTLSNLTRGVACSTPVAHAQNAEVLWSGLAEVLALSGNPPADLYDGQSLESTGPSYFRGDGTGLSYRMPTDPTGGNDFFSNGQLQWGATVDQTPMLTGWCALYYVPDGSYDESQSGIDLNHDGDKTDVFDIGQIHRARWSTANPAGAPNVIAIGPSVVLQERCHYGSDLDGDGFGDPIFLWDPVSGRLHLRLFVLGRNTQGYPTVRRVESMVFLRNSDGG